MTIAPLPPEAPAWDAQARLAERCDEIGLVLASSIIDPRTRDILTARRNAYRTAAAILAQDTAAPWPGPTAEDRAWADQRLAALDAAPALMPAAPAPKPAEAPAPPTAPEPPPPLAEAPPIAAPNAAMDVDYSPARVLPESDAAPRNRGRPPSECWTPDRLALAERLWAENQTADGIVDACNHLPAGAPIPNAKSIWNRATRLGWKRNPIPPAPPKAAPAPVKTSPGLRDEAMEMLAAGIPARMVADELGVAASVAAEWAAQHRASRQQSAA